MANETGPRQETLKAVNSFEEDDLSNRTIRPSSPADGIHKSDRNCRSNEPTTPVNTAAIAINLGAVASSIQLSPTENLEAVGKGHLPRKAKGQSPDFRRSKSCRSECGSRGSSRKSVGIVIGDFQGLYADELTLNIGERIEIISKDTVVSRNIGWWTGRNNKGQIGIFPAASVKVISTGSSSEYPDEAALEVEKYPLEIPVDEITLMEVVGIGGFGKVHRAMYKGEEVAVKVARHTTYDTVKAISDVISEAEKFAKLAHDNVCALVGVCLVKDICLVMEYAKGGSLSKLLHERNISLPVDIILDWSKQISVGMEYLHHEAKPPLIHRDLKSSNILLQNTTYPENLHGNVIKITDFGLAREIEHTTHMSGAGTYPWMAPEVIRQSEFSQKSDVWSFGVVMWELLTGEKPYSGLNMFVVAYGVGHGTLTLPIPEKSPESHQRLLSACWQRDHTVRPSFTEIKRSLTEMQCSEFSHTPHDTFRSIQHSWKQEVQKRFQELKKIESELESREKELIARMQLQEKRVEEMKAQLEEKEENLQEMMQRFHEQVQKLTIQRENRPPRIRRFSPRRLLEWLTGHETKKGRESARNDGQKREDIAKELQRRMRDLQKDQDRQLSHISSAKKACLPLGLGRGRQFSDSAEIDSPPDEEHVVANVNAQDGRGRVSPRLKGKRGGSLITRREKNNREKHTDFLTPNLPLHRDRSISDPRILPLKDGPLKPHTSYAHYPDVPPHSPKQMHNCASSSVLAQMAFQRTSSAGVRSSVESSPISPKISLPEFCQYDSGKESITSDASGNSTNSATLMGSSRDPHPQESLIDFDKPLNTLPPNRSFLEELDPLASMPTMPTHRRQDSGPTHSVDSLFSEATCSFNSTMSTSPETLALTGNSARHMASTTSPRQSVSLLDGTSPTISRPRPRPSSTSLRYTPLGHTMSQENINLTGVGMGFTSSAPSSRPPSPHFNQVSPTGSVQSLPQYPTYATNDIYTGFASDSSASSSLLDLSATVINSGYWNDIVEKPLPPPLLGYLPQQ